MTTFPVAEGVHGIDVETFDTGFNAAYLFDDEEPTLVDSGAPSGAETLLAGLTDCGVAPESLENLVLSHVHVDHSGAACELVDAAPDLDVYIHELTAPHLIDPSGLVESSRAAMGEYFEAIGEQGPVPEGNVTTVTDSGLTLDIGDHSLEIVHAPGHSPDHCAVWNPERRLLYAAECLGGYLGRADRWVPPSTLPNFDVEAVDDAIETLRALDPEHVCVPHFGVWPDAAAEVFETAKRELHRFDEQILEFHERSGSRAETRRLVAEELLDVSPPYAEALEAFYARLITDGYLRYHRIE